MDICATLCEAAGVAPPAGIDGVSFLPTILGAAQAEPDRELYFLLREGGPVFGGKTIEALIRGPWKLLQDRPFGPRELFNLERDPQETTDLAGRTPGVLRELDAALRMHVQYGGQVPWQPRDRAAAYPPRQTRHEARVPERRFHQREHPPAGSPDL